MRACASPLTFQRLPKQLQERLHSALYPSVTGEAFLAANEIYEGDARQLIPQIKPNSVALSVWSPPYFVGKSYESDLSFDDWQALVKEVIALHYPVIKPGGS